VDKLHISAALLMERTLVPMEQDAGWSPEPVWAILENNKPLPGFEPWTIPPVATHYTDHITLACCILKVKQSHYRPEHDQRVPGSLGSQIL